MSMLDYPGIRAAALAIAYDNGLINRYSTQERFLNATYDRLYTKYGTDDMVLLDVELQRLDEGQLDALCCGGEGEPEQAHALGLVKKELRNRVNELLNDIFEEGGGL